MKEENEDLTNIVCWLISCKLIQARVLLEEGVSTEKIPPKDLPVFCSAFSWLVSDLRGSSSLWVMLSLGCHPGCYKKANWANYEEQVSNQNSFMASVSGPASRFLPLSLYNDGLWCGNVNWKQTNKQHFSTQVALSMFLIIVIDTQTNGVISKRWFILQW